MQQSAKESFEYASSLLQLPELLVSRFQGASNINALLRDVNGMVKFIVQRNSLQQKGSNDKCDRKRQTDDVELEAKVDALRQSLKLLDLDLTHGHPLL